MITVFAITGYSGRMGQAIADIVKSDPRCCLAGGVCRSHAESTEANDDTPIIITKDPAKVFPKCDAIIDFSNASVVTEFVRSAATNGKPFLCGTTGLDAEAIDALHKASESIPVLHSTNTSLSLVVVKQLVELAARLLKDHDYDISILDRHHKWKKDAPSGTALTIGKAALKGNGGAPEPTYASIRGGAIVGEHETLFAGHGEYINIQHVVTDRRVFARGAVEVGLWLAKQKPGFYTMDDVLKPVG